MNTTAIYLFKTLNSHSVTSRDLVINVCISMLALVIILLNVTAIVTLRKRSDVDNYMYFLANLAVADFLTGIFVLYDVCYNILQFKYYVECVIRIGLYISVNQASVLNLAALTMERYVKIAHYFAYIRHVTLIKLKIIEGGIWLFSIAVGSLPFFGWCSRDTTQVCNVFGIMAPSYFFFLVSLFIAPLLLMILAYIKIVLIALRHQRSRAALQEVPVGGRNAIQRTSRSVRVVVMIVGAYVLCWSPVGLFTLLFLVTDIRQQLRAPGVIFTYLLALGILNSVLNPIIYAAKIPAVRTRMQSMFCSYAPRSVCLSFMNTTLNMCRQTRHPTFSLTLTST